jgi:flagellar basal-body rod modification protein FlgD
MADSIYSGLDLGDKVVPPLSEQNGPPYDFSSINEGKPTSEMDKDTFLMLFIEQLQNQDPLNPMDGHEFVAQLATFTQLEQAYQTNKWLETISAYQSSLNSSQSLTLLGREVTALGNLLVVSDGEPTPCNYVLPEDGTVTVKIYDHEGELVRTLEQGKEKAGYHSFTWNGEDEFGEQVPDGSYTYTVTAQDANDYPQEVVQLCTAQVTGIRFDDAGNPLLLLGPEVEGLYDDEGEPIDPRISIYLSDILEVATGSGTTTQANSAAMSKLLSQLGSKAGNSLNPQALTG